MAKKFICRIGYADYAVELDDAATLLAIAGRASVVKQKNYSGPYIVQPEGECFVDQLNLADGRSYTLRTQALDVDSGGAS